MTYGTNRHLETFQKAASARTEERRQAEEARKTTIADVWAPIADYFKTDSSFKIDTALTAPGEVLRTVRITSRIKPGQDITVSDNGDGTFCLNRNGTLGTNKKSPDQVAEALAVFYVDHKDTFRPATIPELMIPFFDKFMSTPFHINDETATHGRVTIANRKTDDTLVIGYSNEAQYKYYVTENDRTTFGLSEAVILNRLDGFYKRNKVPANALHTTGASSGQQPTLDDVLEAMESGIRHDSNFFINGYSPAAPQEDIQTSVRLGGEIRIKAANSGNMLHIRNSKNNIGTFEIEYNGAVLDTDASLHEVKLNLTKFQMQKVDPSARVSQAYAPGQNVRRRSP